MKKRLNIFCILIFVTILCSFIHFLSENSEQAFRIFKQGWDEAGESREYIEIKSNEFHVSVTADDTDSFADSVYNAKSKKWIPMQYHCVIVKEQKQQVGVWIDVLSFAFSLVLLIAIITQFNCFIRFILAVNRSVIFHWANVSRLRWLGWSMVVVFISQAVLVFCWHAETVAAIDIPGYKISYNGDMWDFFTLILGLGVLIIAEVFAIGLRLQEEQELTV